MLILFFSISLLAQIKEVKKAEPDTQLVKKILIRARAQTFKGSDSALYYAKLARSISLKNKYTKGVANSFMEVGEYYNSKGMYERSFKNYTEANRLYDSINYKQGMSYAANSIGNMYLGWGNLNKALYNYQKSYEIAYKDSNKFMMCVALFGMANINDINKEYKEAFKCYSKTLIYIKTVPQCNAYLPLYYINISSVLNALKKHKLAILNLHKALAILEPTNDLYAIGAAYKAMGIAFSDLNIEDSAFYYFDKSEQTLLKKDGLDEIQNLYLEISDLYKKKKNYQKALDYFVKHSVFKDSVFNLNKSKQIFEIEKVNENREIKKNINHITKELIYSKENAEDEKHEKEITYVFLVVLLVALTFIVFLFLKNRKTNLFLEQKNKEKNILVQEIHHRVKNNLQFIAAMLTMQINSIKDESNQKILKETSRRINAMSLVHEMLYNKEKLEYVSLKEYISELVAKLKELVYDTDEPIDFKLNIEDVKFNINNCVAIGMITSEIISNAIKYAFSNIKNPTITITLKHHKTDKNIVYSIQDNGVGLVASENKAGLGLRLIDIFSRQMEADYTTINDNGLKYIFKIPYDINEK